MKTPSFKALVALVLLFHTAPLRGQNYSVDWFEVAGGGGASTGGAYAVAGTIGQQDAGGPMRGSGYSVISGFWSLDAPVLPDFVVEPINTNIIDGGSVVLSVSLSGTSPFSYQWYFDGAPLSYGTNATLVFTNFSPAIAGTYQVEVSNEAGSILSAPFTVEPLTFSVNWFKVAGGGGASTGGVYSVTGTVGQQDAGGPMQACNYSVEGGFWSLYANIPANPVPSATITVPASVCANSTGNGASVPSAGAGAIYSWTIGNGTITSGSTSDSITFSEGASGTDTLSVLVTSSAGCSSSGSTIVPVNALPSATIIAPGAVCAGSASTASVSPTVGATYTWTISNGSIISGQGTSNITFSPGFNPVTLDVTVTSSAGCSSSSSTMVTVNPAPSATITTPSAALANTTGNVASVSGTASGSPSITTLHSFSGLDGEDLYAGLVQGNDGNFYGTSPNGGTSGSGTVFKITSAGTFTTLYQFSGPDGAIPAAGLVQGTDGNFYGTTEYGGNTNLSGNLSGGAGDGTVFRITSAGTLTTLYQFSGFDGANPVAGLVQGSDGNFYGTASASGMITNCYGSCGTVFKITSAGTLTTLHSFGDPPNGTDPVGSLVQGSDGNFYGTTWYGVTNGAGTVFKITSAGTFTTLYQFSGPDGSGPVGSLVQGSDSNFYGTTSQGGTNNCSGGCGTVFRITSAGTLTTLYQFSGLDGTDPQAGLVQGSDGNFYGTTQAGGTSGSRGTVFTITPAGTLTTLHSFSSSGSDGRYPDAGLVQSSDGNFYGTTSSGGTSTNCNGGCGTVFEISAQTYSWTINSSGSITSGQGSPNINFNAGTNTITLSATVTGFDGCSSTETATINVYSLFPWWQYSYFGTTNNNADTGPNVDVYGTGMSNTNKFLAGFSPTNAAAYLHIISVTETNNNINVIYLGPNGDDTWSPGIASRTNVLEYTAGRANGSYSNNFASTGQTNILSGGNGLGVVTNITDSGGATNVPSRYYRVRVLVP